MAIQQKLHTKLVQKLILTPSLQQAIKLLPMSTLELADLLNQEIVENPMLDEVQSEDVQPADGVASEKADAGADQPQKSDSWEDSDYAYFFGYYLDDGYRPKTPTEVKELPPIENTLSTATSLADHLRWQLTLQPGDRLYFYTDGLTEAMDAHEEDFGHARLMGEIARWRDQPLRAGLERISSGIRDWCGGALKDDASLLAVERLE